MAELPRDIYVKEVMTRSPVTCKPGITARKAAAIMKEKNVGSLIVVENGDAAGIITERDLIEKVVAQDLKPSKVKVESVMTSPLITISQDTSLAEAARMMAKMGLRRLPVVTDGKLAGILTENDILKISPSLIELTREWSRLRSDVNRISTSSRFSGYCESCGTYSDNLMEEGGRLLCDSCLDR